MPRHRLSAFRPRPVAGLLAIALVTVGCSSGTATAPVAGRTSGADGGATSPTTPTTTAGAPTTAGLDVPDGCAAAPPVAYQSVEATAGEHALVQIDTERFVGLHVPTGAVCGTLTAGTGAVGVTTDGRVFVVDGATPDDPGAGGPTVVRELTLPHLRPADGPFGGGIPVTATAAPAGPGAAGAGISADGDHVVVALPDQLVVLDRDGAEQRRIATRVGGWLRQAGSHVLFDGGDQAVMHVDVADPAAEPRQVTEASYHPRPAYRLGPHLAVLTAADRGQFAVFTAGGELIPFPSPPFGVTATGDGTVLATRVAGGTTTVHAVEAGGETREVAAVDGDWPHLATVGESVWMAGAGPVSGGPGDSAQWVTVLAADGDIDEAAGEAASQALVEALTAAVPEGSPLHVTIIGMLGAPSGHVLVNVDLSGQPTVVIVDAG